MGRAKGGGPARDRALDILVDGYEGDLFGLAALAEWQEESPLSDADAGLAAELVAGTFHHRITCEHLAAHFHRGRWAGLDVRLRVILALGVYQLCWLERVPDHAVVDAAVNQAKGFGRHAAGMVNGILRHVAEARGPMVEAQEGVGPRRWLPTDGGRGRVFNLDMFPDPARRPLEYLIAVTSHPSFLVERWHRRFKPVLCRQVLDAGQRRPSLVLRPNPMRTTATALIERLAAEGVTAREYATHVIVEGATDLARLAVFRDGLCQPQDSTAGLALRLAGPKPGEFVIDLCAGSGTKSTQAAEMMGDRGRVVAVDRDDERLERIAGNAERLGLSIIRVMPLYELDEAVAAEGRPPDWIVVDAPCSNTGVLARRPEARYRATWQAIDELVEIQAEILARAVAIAGPTTRIVYSTCSIEREEDEKQVRAFVAENPNWRLVEERLTLPDAQRDGGYVAIVQQS